MGLLGTSKVEIREVLSTQSLCFMILSDLAITPLDFRSSLEDQVNAAYIISR